MPPIAQADGIKAADRAWLSVQRWTGIGGGEQQAGDPIDETIGSGNEVDGHVGGGGRSLVPVSAWIMVQGNRAANECVMGEKGIVSWWVSWGLFRNKHEVF